MSIVFYLATCQDCTPPLPVPFYDEIERDEWARVHSEANGHVVVKEIEAR